MRRLLLDTNAYSAIMKGHGDRILSAIDDANHIVFSTIVIGELHAGFREGNRLTQNVETLKEFLSDPLIEIKGISQETAEIFGELKYILKKQDTPLPLNDIWIAAQCVEHGAILATYDQHFKQIMGLRLLNL